MEKKNFPGWLCYGTPIEQKCVSDARVSLRLGPEPIRKDWATKMSIWCEALSLRIPPGGRRRPQTNPSYAQVSFFSGNQHGTTFLELPEKSEGNFYTSNVSGRHCHLRSVPQDLDVSSVSARSSPSTPKLGPNQGRHLSGRA